MSVSVIQPDLRSIGERAFTEVLSTLLSLPANVAEAGRLGPQGERRDQIIGRLQLSGQRFSGSLHVQLPLAFLTHAVHLLTGLDGEATSNGDLLDDAAGELANMIAGRVAAQLSMAGYACTLGTPTISRGECLPVEPQAGGGPRRVELVCAGQRLVLEIRGGFANS